MRLLTCEMCGGTDLIKCDGFFLCQNCGMKYSVEEAKKMMIEGTVQVAGSVSIDASESIKTYLKMAKSAYDASNFEEAEQYCNKTIEISPCNYQALMLKGKSAGWQSTLQNDRFIEAINYFSLAISNAPEDEHSALIDDAKTEFKNLSQAIMRLQGERFGKWPDKEETQGMLNVLGVILKALLHFLETIDIDVINKNEFMAPIATIVNNSVMDAWNKKIVPEFNNDNDGYPGDYSFKQFIERAGYCERLLQQAIELSDVDDAADAVRYQNIIDINNSCIQSCSYEYRTVEIPGTFWSDWHPSYKNQYCQHLFLAEDAKNIRRGTIAKCNAKIRSINHAIAKKEAEEKAERERIAKEQADERYRAYWIEHAAEKNALETEKDDLEAKVYILRESIAEIPEQEEKKRVQEYMEKLIADRDALGFFKIKEKKCLQEKIDMVYEELEALSLRVDAARVKIEKKIEPLQLRIDVINEELSKPR